MKIAAMTFKLYAPWVHSLKEKRMIVKSLIAKLQNRFHVSVAEIVSVKPCACDLCHLDAILEKINKLEVFSSEVRQWISLFTKSDSAATRRRKMHVDRCASLKAGGAGIHYVCRIQGQPVELYYEENGFWFVSRKVPKP